MENTTHKITDQPSPQDGLDNTGTQGYDSLSDDAYKGSVIKTEQSSNDPSQQAPVTISSPPNEGEKIIVDVLINEKLAHVIVTKNRSQFHINLDGKDIGRFELNDEGKIKRFPQPSSAHIDHDVYFAPIEEKLKELNKLN
ncbi:MAG: hypothetical protein REI64_10785 [Pedobacter sp.]|uniref:hypothetical protein n=1 Tax=Pedobacter sp. TaxID=1411316 RepID=UPI0028074EEB|nr:hypothetical protein [Pedobacter sp.]MDQ8005276.1 hypothetical protein [Pedobacter sp.]